MNDSIFNTIYTDKEQGFKFVIEENISGYEPVFQAVLYTKSLDWRKKVGLATKDYKEAIEELDFFRKYGFNFGGVVCQPRKEAVSK